MRIPMRAALRLAFAGWLGLAGLSLTATPGRAATPPENVLPGSTIAFLKAQDAATLREAFAQSQFGQLWNDPGMKTWRDDVSERIAESGKSLKSKLGVTYKDLLELPQGAVSVAAIGRDDPKLPIAIVISADAGKNSEKMADVLARATKQGEESGAKISEEKFKGTTIHVIQPAKSKPKADSKAKNKEKDADKPEPPVVWTREGTVFLIGSDVDTVKDLVAHAQGREDSLAANESYLAAKKKLGSESHAAWFIDLAKLLKMVASAGAKGNDAQAQQTEAMIQVTGLSGLKAAAGTFLLNSGNFDTVTKTTVLSPAPAQGVLKVFMMPKVSLRPEPWVPATVASYQSYSWDLDGAYNAINDLANMFQPGMLNVLEQQLVGPNGGEPLNFKKDVFGPLGDRITLISDFKKPIKEDNQRMLVGVALEDAKAFQNTLTKLIALSGGAPKKRDFQGTVIYDFQMPDLPNNANANAPKLKGPISVAIAKNTLFLASEPTLLEQILRGGSATLAESPAYLNVAREMPDQVSTISFVRPEEQARISYDMVKSGQFEKALKGAAVAGGPDLGKLGNLIDKDKLPDFSIFAKYLSPGGGYGVQDDDGITWTGFSLRKTKP